MGIGSAWATGVVVALLLLLQMPPVATWLVRRVAVAENPYPGHTLVVGRTSGGLVRGLELEALRLVDTAGATMLAVERVRVRYRLLPLLRRRIVIEDLVVEEASFVTRQLPDSTWDLLAPFTDRPVSPDAETSEDAPDTGWEFELHRFAVSDVSGRAWYLGEEGEASLEVENLAVVGGAVRAGSGLAGVADTLTLRFLPRRGAGGWAELAFAGRLADGRLDVSTLSLRSDRSELIGQGSLFLPESGQDVGEVDFSLHATRLAYRDLEPFLPGFEREGELELHLELQGAVRQVRIRAEARFSDGATAELSGEVTPLMTGPLSFDVEGTVHGLDLALVTGSSALGGAMEANFDVELEGGSLADLSGRLTVELSGIEAARHTVGRASLQAGFESGEAEFELSMDIDSAGVSAHGTLTPFADALEYDVSVGLDDASTLIPAGWTAPGLVAVEIHVSGVGLGPATAEAEGRIDVVTTPVDEATAPSRLTLEGMVSGGEAEITAVGDLLGGSVDGAIQLFFGDVFRYEAESVRFERLDPTLLSASPGSSSLTGQLSISGSGGTAEAAVIDVELAVDSSRYASLEVSRLAFESRLEEGAISGRLTGSSPAGRLELNLSGRWDGRWRGGDSFIRIEEGLLERLDVGVLLGRENLETDIRASMQGELTPGESQPIKADVLIELESSRVNQLALASGRLALRLEEGVFRAEGSFESEHGELSFRGEALPFVERPEYRIEEANWSRVELGRLLGTDRFQADLRGSLVAAASGYPLDVMAGSAELRLDGSTVNEQILNRARFDLVLDSGMYRLVGGASGDDGGLDFSVTAEGSLLGDEPTINAAASLRAERVDNLLARDSLGVGLSLDAEVRARGLSPSDAVVTAHLTGGAEWSDATVDSVLIRLDYARGVLDLDTLSVRGSVGTVTASGTLALTPGAAGAENDMSLSATLSDIEPLSRLLGHTVGLAQGDLTASLTGPPNDRDLEISLSAAGPKYGDVSASTLALGARVSLDAEWNLVDGSTSLSAGGIRVAGAGAESLEVTATLDGDSTLIEVRSIVDGRRDFRVHALLTTDGDHPRLVLDRLDARLDESLWRLDQSVVVHLADSVSVSGLRLRSSEEVAGDLTVEGFAGGDGVQRLDVRLDSLSLERVSDLFGLPDLGGSLSASFALRGTARAPQVTGSVLATLDSAGVAVGRIAVEGRYLDSLVVLDGSLVGRHGDSIRVEGRVPAVWTLLAPGDSTGRLELRPSSGTLVASAFDLSTLGLLVPNHLLMGVSGTLEADVEVGGTLGDASMVGQLSVSNAGALVPALEVDYREVALEAELEGRTVTLSDMMVRTDDGSLRLDGSLELAPEGSFNLNASLSDFWLMRTNEYSGRASGELHLGGTTLEPRVLGSLDFTAAAIRIGDASLASADPVELTEADYRMLDENFGYSREAPSQPPFLTSFLDAADIDLTLALTEGGWVRRSMNPEIAVEATGGVRILKGPGGTPSFEGALEPDPRRSYVSEFGRRFDIVGGSITFGGPVESIRVDIQAEYEVPSRTNPGENEVVIELGVRGSPDELSLVLSSEPRMDDGDIVSYLATGGPAGEAGGLAGSAVADVAFGGISDALEGAAQEAVGLDVMEIRFDGLRGATIIAGRYLTPEFYVGFKQPLAFSKEAEESTSSSTQPELELEYEAYRWLLLNLQGGRSGFRFFLRSRYSY